MKQSTLRKIDNSWDYELSNGLHEYNRGNKAEQVSISSLTPDMYTEEYFSTHCICCGSELFSSIEDVFLLEFGELCTHCNRDMGYEYEHNVHSGVQFISEPLLGDKVTYSLNRMIPNSLGDSSEPISLSDYVNYNTPQEDDRSVSSIISSLFSSDNRTTQLII